MKTQLTASVAAAITLLMNSAPSTAAEPRFQAPATERARQSAQLPTQTAHWTAAIGTGHVSESTAKTNRSVIHGAPASPHWAAAIGTGSASQNSVREVTSPVPSNPSVAGAHWASKIGTGQVSESTARAARSASAVVANTSTSTSP